MASPRTNRNCTEQSGLVVEGENHVNRLARAQPPYFWQRPLDCQSRKVLKGFEESWTMRKSASRFAGPTILSLIGVSAGADIVSPARARTARPGSSRHCSPV